LSNITNNLNKVLDRISGAADKAGRDLNSIKLIVVTKTQPISMVQEVRRAGATNFGENRVQEAIEKFASDDTTGLHMIGPLQRNKAKFAVKIFNMIQSVDRFELGQELDRRLEVLEKSMPILIQVNTSLEASKAGVNPDQALELVGQLSTLKWLSIKGLMTIPEFKSDPEDSRPAFRLLREIRDQITSAGISGVSMDFLSMGMSHDFEVAIDEGADMVRVGTAIFGPRQG
tara:strand:- start:139467 stop:140156 length:690 start_codon:yes stop_codon:yes gene_type:complete